MKLVTTIAVLLISVYSISLCASARINLPIKSYSSVFEGDIHSKVNFGNYLDSTQNQGNVAADIVWGVAEVVGGCIIVTAGGTALLYGMVIHLFRPEDRNEWIALYSLGTAGTALGLFVIDDGIKRIGFRGLFTSKQIAQPGIYYSE
tara:strand:- start:890 stop:1330 length:441 start_codon:yes stop_codon:yes gene_type:complete